MHSDQAGVGSLKRRFSVDWIVGLFLFAATAAIVVWQNSRLAIVWDLSYILENAYRISLGQLPYRDFPFPYAPLTFLIQAALIRLTGRVFWHTTVYCAVLNGTSTLVTWRILIRVLRDFGTKARWLATLLALPLIPLGIYSIFPHPFYDPDCTLTILIAVYLLQRADEAKDFANARGSWIWSLLAGASLAVPLFVKQNTGLAFVSSSALGLILAFAIDLIRRKPARAWLLTIAGAVCAFAIALGLIAFTAGLRNYWHWTIEFAASRRTPARAEMLAIYADKALILWLGLLLSGVVMLWLSRRRQTRILAVLSSLFLLVPFIWPTIYLLRDSDPSERAERLINLWPVLIVFSFIIAVVTIKRRRGIAMVLPFVLIATVHGAFMSQQLWGSTYAIWPLFMILLAMTIADLKVLNSAAQSLSEPDGFSRFALPLTAVIVLSLLISGGLYLKSHERLDYTDLDDGELMSSSLPQLKGMATRGDWIPNFEELVNYTDAHVPRDEAILLLPGEDLFYYTTGRTPKFPVLMFDHTVNPYSPAEILDLARTRDIRWLIVKQEMQDEDEGIEKLRDELTETLDQDFEEVESLGNYEIYHRRDPNKKEEDDDDK